MHQFSESQTKVPWSAIILKIVIFIRICMVNGQGLPVQLICHTKPYNNRNFQIDGASRYFGVWLWQLVHLLILVCSFQWCVLFLCLAKLYRSCPIRDKGLLILIFTSRVAAQLDPHVERGILLLLMMDFFQWLNFCLINFVTFQRWSRTLN